MRTAVLVLLIALGAGLLGACGKKRRYGDEGGTPVSFIITLDRAFVSGMRNRQGRLGVGAGVGLGSGGHSSVGGGVGMSFSATTVDIYGGEGPGEGQIFRHEIGWGETRFSVPLMPGRVLHITVQATGGREGWECVGSVTIPATGSTVHLDLGEAGPVLRSE
ncbi:MAG: hypothetical protein H0W72_08255 [Planctomycetes bacterium]|nr:hypothetical protein [Planctomycetota bacterium]